MASFLVCVLIISLNIYLTNCDRLCDCSNIDALKGTFKQEMLVQRLQTSSLMARMRFLEKTKTPPPFREETDADSVVKEHIEMTDKRVEELESRLNKTIVEQSTENLNDLADESQMSINESEDFSQTMNSKLQELERQTTNAFRKLETLQLEAANAAALLSNFFEKTVQHRTDGGWSRWDGWSTCSVSCGGGTRERSRTCTNPRPSEFGRQCEGNNVMTSSCGSKKCKDVKVAFTAYGSDRGTSFTRITFPYTHLNIGGAYNKSTGLFTCSVPGVYNFAVTLTKKRVSIDQVSAALTVHNRDRLLLRTDPADMQDIEYGSYSLSVTGNFRLRSGEYVYVEGVPDFFTAGLATSFTGVLIAPDD